jgi:hypothetical protein
MPYVREFELYLLSQMKARDAVDNALTAVGIPAKDLDAIRAGKLATALASPGHNAQLYVDVLGEPVESAVVGGLKPNSPFAGSTAMRFRLPLWPEFFFVVNRHPSGFAWGPRFERPRGKRPPGVKTVADLMPWRFVEDDFVDLGANLRLEDAWNDWKTTWYEVPLAPQGPVASCLLVFDFHLLQAVELAGAGAPKTAR